jgi:signal transduction histidine kinase
MDGKRTRVVLIEPDASRREFIRSALVDASPELEFQVLSDLSEMQSELEGALPALAFSTVHLQQHAGPLGYPVASGLEKHPDFSAKNSDSDEFKKLVSRLSHDLRNPLGVIANAVYVLKRKGAEDAVILEKYLEVIEQETMAIEQILTDRVHEVL